MNRRLGVIFSYILMAVEILSSFLFTPYLIKSFGQAEYGVYSLSLSITSYLALLDLGVGNAIVRYVSKYRVTNDFESARKLKGFLLFFYFLIFVLVLAVGFLLSAFFPTWFSNGLTAQEISLGRGLVVITTINVAITLLFSLYGKILLAYEKYVLLKTLDILKILVRVSVSIIVLAVGFKSFAIALVNLGCTILFGFTMMIVTNSKTHIKPLFKLRDVAFLREIGSFTIFVFIQMVASQINSMTDHVLLGFFSSAVIIAIYQVASLVSQYFQQMSNAVNGVLQPGAVKLVEQNGVESELIQREMTKVSRIVFMMLGFIYVVFAVNGKSFIHLWVGEGYEESYYAALIMLLPMVLTLSQRIGTNLLWALNKHKVQAVVSIVAAVVNVGISLLLILYMDDIIGAAIGTALATTIGDFLLMNLIYKKEMKIKVIRYNFEMVKNTAICLLASACAGFIFALIHLENQWASFLLNCIVMTFIYCSLMFLFGFTQYERTIIKSFFKRRGRS